MNRIAIIDDDEEIVKIFERVARMAGFEPYATTNPHDFLSYVETFKPTHITLDLQMPELDGVEILRRLAALHNQSKIFFISGFDPKVIDIASKLGREQGLNIVEKISKPISVKDLKALLLKHKNEEDLSKDYYLSVLERREFFLVFQPKLDVKTNQIDSYEALLRWRHPSKGIIGPIDFIPILEKLELFRELSDYTFEEACDAINRFKEAGFDSIKIAVNVSAGDLNDLELANRLQKICKSRKVNPKNIILEITETVAMKDPVHAMDNLTRIRLQEVGLSLDDFGTGFSSLAMLRNMPFNELKIDKMFIDELKESRADQEIIKAVVSIGKAFDMKVVAEGCECANTLALLSKLGCDIIQGYFIAKPMPLDDAIKFLSEHNQNNQPFPFDAGENES